MTAVGSTRRLSSGRRIRTSTDEESLDPSPALSDQDAIDSGRIPAAPETPAEPSDPLGTIEGRRVEDEATSGEAAIVRVELTLKEAVRWCHASVDVRTLRRILLEALRQLEEHGDND